MPTTDNKKNVKYNATSRQRASRAHAYLKRHALREGHMINQVDGAGFDRYMDYLESLEARTGKG